MALTAGARIGPYEVSSLLGEGGMGVVFRARDTKLQRDVALKLLPDHFANDGDRLSRFQREAQVLASLNHPSIAHIYGLEESGAACCIVMELVEGPTLQERLNRGPIPVDEALPMAKQIAEALEAAHERGIIHRDLKPANIKLAPDGKVKVLDFGLAKIYETATPPQNMSNSPTLSALQTAGGAILGTAAYMSPEQARGKNVDRRADVWSFGCVLYEMLTGKRAFDGEEVTDTLAYIITKEPDWSSLPATTPPSIQRVLRRCLQKDLRRRLADMADARIEIEEAIAQPTPVFAPAPSRAPLGRLAWVISAVFFLAAAAVSLVHFRETSPETPVVRATLLPPENATFDFANGRGMPALSPDGRKIVFGARTADGKEPLWVRSLDALSAQPLAGTDGATFPFWSPDSRFIAFFADARLKKIDASGGPAITLADAPAGRGGSWSREGVIIFAPGNEAGPLLRVSEAGGAAGSLVVQGRLPWFLPDGRHFLYYQVSSAPSIRVASLDGGDSKMLMEGGSNALYSQGYLLFLREGTLMAQHFDPKRLATTGEAVPVAERIQTLFNVGTIGAFSVSETGMLVYRMGTDMSGRLLAWFDRNGKQEANLGQPGTVEPDFQFSPDRKSLAISIYNGEKSHDIWIYDVSRGLPTRFTFDPGNNNRYPVWSPDGRSIVFASDRKGHFDLYRKSANGAGAEELLYADNLEKRPTSWSADGKFLLYTVADPKMSEDIYALPLALETAGSPLKPFIVLQTPFNETAAQFSPDGRWIAYQSNESRRQEIYIIPFSQTPAGPVGKRQVSTAGGSLTRWRQDGKEIFYIGPDRRLMAAEVAVKEGILEVGKVRSLFDASDLTQGSPSFDVSADGQHFLLRTFAEQKSNEPLTLFQNWAAALKK